MTSATRGGADVHLGARPAHFSDRQPDDELGPLPGPVAVDRHRPAVQLDHLLDQRQPDPEPALRPVQRPVRPG